MLSCGTRLCEERTSHTSTSAANIYNMYPNPSIFLPPLKLLIWTLLITVLHLALLTGLGNDHRMDVSAGVLVRPLVQPSAQSKAGAGVRPSAQSFVQLGLEASKNRNVKNLAGKPGLCQTILVRKWVMSPA